MNVPEIAKELVGMIELEVSDLDELGRKILARRILDCLRPWLLTETAKPDPLEPFTDEEARRFGAELMAFGKHAGERIDSVDLEYLLWLADASRTTWRGLHRYLNSPRIKAERADD